MYLDALKGPSMNYMSLLSYGGNTLHKVLPSITKKDVSVKKYIFQ